MRRFNSFFLSYGWGLHKTALMGKGWLEWPVLWLRISNIFSIGQEMATHPLYHLRVTGFAESLAADKDNLTIVFCTKKLFWVFSECTRLKICGEHTFWRGAFPQSDQNVHAVTAGILRSLNRPRSQRAAAFGLPVARGWNASSCFSFSVCAALYCLLA